MSRRSIAIGLALAVLIAGGTYYYEEVARTGGRLIPHLMPPIVYGSLLLIVLALNPLLDRLRAGAALTGKELAVITALALVAASVPSLGMIHAWTTEVTFPHHYARSITAWNRTGIVDIVPKRMLVDEESDRAVTGFCLGLAKGEKRIGFFDVPWGAWRRTLIFWVPLMVSMAIAMLALAVVIHRQWSAHEHLPYPIATFAGRLLPGRDAVLPGLFREPLFWVGTATVLAIYMNNHLHRWWPEILIPIRTQFDFHALQTLFPTIARSSGLLFRPRIYFVVVGLAFFFSSEVSFSMWVGPILFGVVFGALSTRGVSVTAGFGLFGNTNIFIFLGGYMGLFLVTLYTGRHYFGRTLLASVLPGRDGERGAVRYMRIFLVALAVFVAQLMLVGIDWVLALPYTLLAVMVFVVVSRVVAETGAFLIGTWVMPGALLVGLLGPQAVGPKAAAILCMVSVAVVAGPGWAPLPFAAQALKLAGSAGVDLPRLGRWLIVTLLICVAVAIPATIYWQYNEGAAATAGAWREYTAKMPFELAMGVKQKIEAQGVAEAPRGLARLAAISPNWTFAGAFGITTLLVILMGAARLRLPWWPLHPVIFFFANSHQGQQLCFSFFLGWALKTLVTRCGGTRLRERCTPLMLGLVAGEVLGNLAPLVINSAYTWVTVGPSTLR